MAKEVKDKPFLPNLFWVLIVDDNVYISISESASSIEFMLWALNKIIFTISTANVSLVKDFVKKIERLENTGNINLLCFPTKEEQFEYVIKKYGAF